jgi:phage shock protein PspC (stress-responsive transcriptional regulator)
MTVKSVTFQVALVIIIIVAVLIIIQSSWTLSQLSRLSGDPCECSGVTDMEIYNLRMYSIIMLIVGLGILIYAILMMLMPGGEKRHASGTHINERFTRNQM